MITEQDLEQAIAECQGERNPNATTCIKLAAYLTIKQALFAEDTNVPATQLPQYSFAGATGEIGHVSDTEFGQAIEGRPVDEILPIIDELMSTLQVVNRRLYDAVMRRI